MAVKTALTRERIDVFLKEYNIGALISYAPIEKGNVQTNYKLETDAGAYVLRIYENRPLESVMFEMDVLRRLLSRRFPVPPPVGPVGSIDLKPAVLFAFMKGEHVPQANAAKEAALIALVARMNAAMAGFVPAHMDARLNYTIDGVRACAKDIAAKHPGFAEKLAWHDAQLSMLTLPPGFPMGVCHCDFHFSNMLFSGDEISCLLDFDDANYTYLPFDLVWLLEPFSAAFDHDTWAAFGAGDARIFDFTRAKRIVGIYQKVRKLSTVEVNGLFDLLKLSVLIDCLWYFSRGEGEFYEKRKIDALNHLGRARFLEELGLA